MGDQMCIRLGGKCFEYLTLTAIVLQEFCKYVLFEGCGHDFKLFFRFCASVWRGGGGEGGLEEVRAQFCSKIMNRI